MLSFPSYEDVQKVRKTLSDISYQHWIHDDFLTWKWWLLLALAIVPWFIWFKIVDKKRFHEILAFGLIMSILAALLDNIGTDLRWWGYPDKLLQMVPPLVPADFTLVPVTFMITYQYFSQSYKSFLISSIIVAILSAYIAEPIMIRLNFYQLNEWKLTYSFLFYIVAAHISWLIVKTKKNP